MLATVKEIEVSFIVKLSNEGGTELQECSQGGGYKATLVRLYQVSSYQFIFIDEDKLIG